MLIFYAGKYVNAVTAEDLVQDVFLKVWQKRTFLFLKEGIKLICIAPFSMPVWII